MKMMRRAICLTLLFAALFAATALPAAASSYLDLSQPMTGKSRSVVNADGTPVDMGVPLLPASVATREEPAEDEAVGPDGELRMGHGMTGDAVPRNAAGSRPDCGPYFGMRRCDSRTTIIPINIHERRERTAKSSSKPFRIRFRRR